MRVILDDVDLAVSEVECLRMGMDGREERSLAKIQHWWENISLNPAGVGHILLTTIKATIKATIILFIYLYFFHISHLGTYHGNGKCHIQYTSSGNL